jgi:hypothetical protein
MGRDKDKDAKKDEKKTAKHGRKMGRLENKQATGKISYDALVKKGEKSIAKLEKSCSHAKTTSETTGTGQKITWCDSCGAQV